MPISEADLTARSPSPEPLTELPFPPVTKSHVLNCSYHSWYPRYRSVTPKARLIPLTVPFLSYLRADGIVLSPEDSVPSDGYSQSPDEDSDPEEATDPTLAWSAVHQTIKSTIAELGGSVMPKLNWSAPKDATWISATNSMDCRTPNDIYLLLKSSDFVTHDLEQVFDDCESDSDSASDSEGDSEEPSTSKSESLGSIPYHLVLRKTIPVYNPSLEFRCFVRLRQLLCICQRDLNHYDFLPPLVSKLRPLVQGFFEKHLKRSFPDDDFVFDVYIPPPHGRVWLIDVNPWAPRTDPLLFSWLEVLNMRGPQEREADIVKMQLDGHNDDMSDHRTDEDSDEDEAGEEAEDLFTPEFRLINRDDPEAYSFSTPQYSAHKLPKDVVDAGADGEAGLREFMGTWREVVAKQEREANEEKEKGGGRIVQS